MNQDRFPFRKQAGTAPARSSEEPGWKALIVDDDEQVHSVTQLALSDFEFEGRPLDLLHAYTGAESIQMLREQGDIAVILMDVVMENDHAGLEAVRAIREELRNRFVRIILRTGQPGQAPEQLVITQYDINDYKEKTELTSKKLFTAIYTALSAYRDLVALDQNRRGLEKVIDASASLLEEHSVERFAQGVLEQLLALMYLDRDSVLVQVDGLAATRIESKEPEVLAGTGRYAALNPKTPAEKLDRDTRGRIRQALETRRTEITDRHFLHYFGTSSGREIVLYLEMGHPLTDSGRSIIELFCRNVALALDNLYLNQQLTSTQRELIIMLSEAIERRSKESGNHVRRVAEYSALLARLKGLPEEDAKLLRMAAPLHDVGKIAIPDAVLNKPGRLDPEEAAVMREHAAIGGEIFADQELPVLRAARMLASEHHEKWDGSGYPEGKSGESIHIFGRIVALADVFDALISARCYKAPWPLEKAIEWIRQERGRHFDPELVDLMMGSIDDFVQIAADLADEHPIAHPEGDLAEGGIN